MMSPLLLVAVLFVPRSVAASTPAHTAADTQATQTDGTLDVRLDLLNARVEALTKLTQKKAVSAMKKCDGSNDKANKERKENRCNRDSQCGKPGQDGDKCQTRNCNYCTDGKTGAKCWNTSECKDGYVCDEGTEKCREKRSSECGQKCDSTADCARGKCVSPRDRYLPTALACIAAPSQPR